MTQLNLSLSEATNRFVQEQVASGRYESPNDFVLDLVEKARILAAKEKLLALILEGENSGEGVEFDEEAWKQRTAELVAEAERRRSA